MRTARGDRPVVRRLLLPGRPAARRRHDRRLRAPLRPRAADRDPLEHEKAGTIPDTEWKKKRFKQPWFPGETLSVAIGQGYVTTTPLQMAQLAATVANGGMRYRPHYVKRVESPDGTLVHDVAPEAMGDMGVRPERRCGGARGDARRRRSRHRQERQGAGRRGRRQDRHGAGGRLATTAASTTREAAPRPRLVHRLRAGRGARDRDRGPGRARRRARRHGRRPGRATGVRALLQPRRGSGAGHADAGSQCQSTDDCLRHFEWALPALRARAERHRRRHHLQRDVRARPCGSVGLRVAPAGGDRPRCHRHADHADVRLPAPRRRRLPHLRGDAGERARRAPARTGRAAARVAGSGSGRCRSSRPSS